VQFADRDRPTEEGAECSFARRVVHSQGSPLGSRTRGASVGAALSLESQEIEETKGAHLEARTGLRTGEEREKKNICSFGSVTRMQDNPAAFQPMIDKRDVCSAPISYYMALSVVL
jgi:hypothetical protein